MPHKVIIYESPESALGSIRPAMNNAFSQPDFSVGMASAADIKNGILQSPDVRILAVPGINGVISPYPKEFGRKGAQEVRQFATHGHNVTLLFCAGISPFISRTLYTPPWGTPIQRKGLTSLFKGSAIGPVAEYARLPDKEKRLSGNMIVPVNFKDTDGTWHKAHICYGNGTPIFPDKMDDPATEIIVTFSDIPENPIAMIRHDLGQGTLYMSCIHPEIHPQKIGEGKNLEMARNLMAELEKHESGRQKLWTMFTNRIKQDLKP